MQYTNKMVLVPEEVANRWMNTPRPVSRVIPEPTTIQGMSRAQEDMQVNLDRHDIPEDVRTKMYEQSLGRFLNYFDQYKDDTQITPKTSIKNLVTNKKKKNEEVQEEPEEEEKEKDDTSRMILSLMPRGLRSKTQDLLHFMEKHADVLSWNERGELVHKGTVLPRTNIVDLVHDVVRHRRSHTNPPLGWKMFSHGLHDVNVPRELIGNQDRWAFMQGQHSHLSSHFQGLEEDKGIKPKKSKKMRKSREEMSASFIPSWTSFSQK